MCHIRVTPSNFLSVNLLVFSPGLALSSHPACYLNHTLSPPHYWFIVFTPRCISPRLAPLVLLFPELFPPALCNFVPTTSTFYLFIFLMFFFYLGFPMSACILGPTWLLLSVMTLSVFNDGSNKNIRKLRTRTLWIINTGTNNFFWSNDSNMQFCGPRACDY